ncbi:MAG: hypothetical protein HDT29_01710 [Clostridiales bacterium]|nr:hypothetical protein [Clostridiales bacterium]
MNLLELEENKLKEVKKILIEEGTIFEKSNIKKYDAKFFETVTLSNTLIKFFLFFSLGLYVVINLIGMIISIIFDSSFSIDIIGTLVGLFAISFIVYAIFSNINTNKKKEEFPIFIIGENFIFNFTDGVVETSKVFYTLPYDSVQKIEFVIHSLRKNQLFGSVTFTFEVLDYTVTHSLRYTNLTAIENFIKGKLPSLLDKLIVDGKSNIDIETTNNNQILKNSLISLAILIVAITSIIVPYLLNFKSLALTISCVILILTSVIIFFSSYLYTHFLVQGIIISSVFIIIGFCVPMLIIERSQISIINYIIQNPQILMTTIFGIIGLCLYAYIVIININKIHYMIHKNEYHNK